MKFIHAADIHLDSPLTGLSAYSDAPVEMLRNATREAFTNLVTEAIEQEVDFMVIAGDLYDGTWKDHNTGIFFCAEMGRLRKAGIPVYENDARRLSKDGQPFWLAGLGDQWAFQRGARGRKRGRNWTRGIDDLPATMALIKDDAPVILMMHEPDAFPSVPARVALTLAGHTHGGQVVLGGYPLIVPSRYGRRYAYGHIVEEWRHLIVSGGLGCSMAPVRFGVPPEIVVIELGGAG